MKAYTRCANVVALLSLLLLTGCKVELFAGVPESEANEIVSVLLQSGVSAAKAGLKDGMDSISVEQDDFPRAVGVLKQRGLPRKQFQTIGDVFQQNGLVVSPMQERARFLWALGQELSSTISQIDGVLTARVQVVLPDNDIMRREPSPSSASVFVRHSLASPAAKLVPQIKALVANSVEGLTYDKVSVVLVAVEPEELSFASAPADKGVPLGPAVGAGMLAFAGLGLVLFRHRLAALLRLVAPVTGK